MSGRPYSKKVRAILLALQCDSVEALVRDYARSPLTQREIAEQWERRVRERFPELDIRVNNDDVSRLFRKCGARSQAVMTGDPLEAVA